jgi:transglutaminase-like putative cysteine protease
VTILLFFFFPRFHSFLPTANINRQGKVGYSKSINNSTISDLLQSTQIAFYAKLPNKLQAEQLYWRGRVHTYTDGYNWSYRKLPATKPIQLRKNQPVISYDLKYEQDFDGDIILLDSPVRAKGKGLGLYSINQTFEYRSYIKKKKAVISAEAILAKDYETELTIKQRALYTQSPQFTPKELRDILVKIAETKPDLIIETFRTMILSDGYTYTLSPGLLPSMASFIQTKKGYCSHYSSLLGLVLRKKGVPTRLVSGFQGGRFNDIGQFYEINSNDAHVWVEYFSNKKWNRVDPTGFVAPNRVRLGGNQDALASQIAQGNANKLMRGYYRAKLFFETLNYRLSALIDSYDRGKQREISKNIKINLTNFFIIGFGLIAILLGLYYYFSNRNKATAPHPADIYLEEFLKILKSSSNNIKDYKTISALKEVILGYSHQHELQEFIKLYQVSRYSNFANLDLLRKQLIGIKNLNPKK